MKEKRERLLIAALAFALPGLVMLWVYGSLGIAPFGDSTVLVSDMSSQYVDFFCALKNGELFFSWSKVLGTGYIGVFSYYVSSPLSFLTLLVPNEAMPVGLALLTVLKIALAGLSFCVFAQRRVPGCGVSALICAVCYALMSYNAAYSLCIMWLDGVIWLPMILLALERILEGKGMGPFVAALTVCFISTWYISYMIGLFCVLYLCTRLIAVKPGKKALTAVLARFFGGAASALGLTAWMWLPTFLAMFSGKFRGANPLDYARSVLCSPVHLIGRLLPGQYGGLDNSAMPYIFCGTVTLVLVVAYFSFWEPYQREKLANRVVLILLFLSMIFAPLDKVWHLFQPAHWFPFRYAFLLSFFLLYMAVQALAPALAAAGKKYGHRVERGAALVLAVFVVVEMGLNTKGLLAGLQERYGSDSYLSYQKNYAASAQLAAAAREDAGERFYRVGSFADRGQNNPLAVGYPGITHYSSLYHYNVNRLLKSLGFAQSWYWCTYRGSTPVTDALLDVEYVISRNEIPGYRPIAQAGGSTLWKNPDVLPLTFLGPEGGGIILGDTPFERQNSLFSSLLWESVELFTPVSAGVDARSGETTFTLTGSGRPVYADLSASGLQEVLVNGKRLLSLGSDMTACVHCLGTPQAGEEWTVTVRSVKEWTGQLWELDQNALHAAVERLDKAEVTSVEKNGRVRLTVRAGGGQVLNTTIPVEDGWAAYVDGEKVNTGSWADAFLTVPVPAGEHTVELRYTAPGLVPGAALGVLSAAGLALAALRRRRSQ